MKKNTVSTAGGAMPKINRSALMTRAWAIFRQTYCYPQIKFSDIGRKCFAWALRQAWIEAREAARIAALSPAAKAERIETLQSLISRAGYIDSGPQWKATIAAHRDEIRQLQTARKETTATHHAKRAGRMRKHSPGPDHPNPSSPQSEISR